ncbi:MAG: hypothetical protein JWP87_1491 [Labilithrix sp.]|nr:hypothetical protein [Labilithrix sp.]
MNTRRVSRLAVVLSSIVALGAFACSSAPPDTGADKSSGETKTAPKKAGNDTTADTGTSTPEPSTPLSDTAACGQKATAKECGDCCLAKTPTAFDAADDEYFGCLCAATACATACAASVCATADNQNEPTAACNTCLDTNEETCGKKADAICAANADCKAADACMATSCEPLAKKEEAAAGGGGMKTLSVRASKVSSRQR